MNNSINQVSGSVLVKPMNEVNQPISNSNGFNEKKEPFNIPIDKNFQNLKNELIVKFKSFFDSKPLPENKPSNTNLSSSEIAMRAMQLDINYKAFVEEAIFAILIADETGGNLHANDVAWQLFGYTKEEFLHLNLTHLMFPEDVQDVTSRIMQLSSGKPSPVRNRYRKEDGTAIFVNVNAKTLANGLNIIFIKEIEDFN